jgi:cytochrome c
MPISTPGDGAEPESVHPSFTLNQARPDNFQPRVGGIDFLGDGRMVVSTWDSLGSIYIVDGVKAATPNDIKVKRIASGLAEPLGLKVVDNEIYVLQKQELTKLVDLNKDELIDEYQTVANAWRVSANFHEFAFGLVYKDGYFYGALATAINPGGASTKPQIPDRGKIVKISKKDGSVQLISRGLRTPNGVGIGIDDEIFIADNQGDWLPANKIVHVQENAFYGSRSVDFEGTANLKETLPVVWLTQDEIGNSPSQPAKLNVGPYVNQMVHGDVTHGGLKRVFAEKINGAYQGVVFRFTQGLEAGVNRLAWGPDGSLYIGEIGVSGNWGQTGKLKYGLQKLTFNNTSTFEMLAVRAKPNGVEIEFTEPLKSGSGEKASDYTISQWYFKPTAEYGGPKLGEKGLEIKSVKVSDDRKKAYLELPGMQSKHVVYIRLNKKTVSSATGKDLWATEAWYTMNAIPSAN